MTLYNQLYLQTEKAMIDAKLYQKINKLREKSNKNKLIVFVGSGVSRNVVGMPSWSHIVKCMADELQYEKCKKCRHKTDTCQETCEFKDDYSTDELLKIPQYLYNADKEAYNSILSKEVRDVDFDAPLSHLIFDLNPKHIITTNYDRLLERSRHILAKQYQVIVENKDLLNSDNNKYIVKMHGCIQDPHTIILKEDDYLDYSQNHILIETFLKSLIVDNTILFLGYSINDYNVKLILSWLNYFKKSKSSLPQKKNIGYIVLDDEKLDNIDEEYFKHNNIEVINIHNIKPMDNIPNSISLNAGKRLFTFLKILSNPHMDILFDKDIWLSRIISALDDSTYINYKDLLRLLYLDKTEGYNIGLPPKKQQGTLVIYQKEIYDNLIDIFSNSKFSKKIKQLFINSGIKIIRYQNLMSVKEKNEETEFEIHNNIEEKLFAKKLFKDWFVCDYKSLNDHNDNVYEELFYRHYVYGYDEILLKRFYGDGNSQINTDSYVGYLFNKQAVENITKHIFKNDELRNYIDNINNETDKIKYRHYLDILNGNHKKRFLMNELLNKIKQNDYCDLENLYALKNYAVDEFRFYFYNNLFFSGFTDLNNILKLYIEGLIYTNKEFQPKTFLIFPIISQKYFLDSIDIIILTAFIEPKMLHSIIGESGIKKLNINTFGKSLIIESLKNNLEFFKTSKFFCGSVCAKRALNLLQILSLINFSEAEKENLSNIISQLLHTENFIAQHFTIHCSDFKLVLRILINAIDGLNIDNGLGIVKKIISSDGFSQYLYNVGTIFSVFIKSLLKKHYQTQKSIANFISTFSDSRKKIELLSSFIGVIINAKLKLQYKQFLMENINLIDENSLILFAVHDWIDIPQDFIDECFASVIKLDKSKSNVQTYPDPYERKIDTICLLFLIGKINGLSELKNVSKKPSYLEFLIDPSTFDYSKVDFSHYMWSNIVRNDKFRNLLIDNKAAFVKKLKEKYLTKTITEDEKKILYKYFLDDYDLWRI